jgi:PAS domain S-box-containing protein
MKKTMRRPTILIIDDDPNNIGIVSGYLDERAYTILIAEDGESGVARAEYAGPDLILLDVMMPGINGFETCRRLKSLEKTKDIPVIFMTALAETEHKVKGFGAGAVDYITKPFRREEVLARVGVHLRIRELTIKLQDANSTLEKSVAERTGELAQTVIALRNEMNERKQAEEERELLATAIEQAGEAIFISDAQWCIHYVNPAFERTNGYVRSEVIGKNSGILKSNSHGGEFYQQVKNILKQSDVWSGRVTNRKKDGSSYEAETTISVVRDKKGVISNFVSIHRDVTHEIQLERELRQSQKMEVIGALAGGIAHDFNNILTAILGFTEIAQSKLPIDDDVVDDLDRVLDAGLRAKELVQQILSFGRQSDPEQKPTQLTPIIKEVLPLLRSSLPSTIEIRQHIAAASKDVSVLADPTQIHRVLMNLGTNAAYAMRENGGVLYVKLSEVDVDETMASRFHDMKPGPYIRLTVKDTGHGMDSTVKERIFDPYFTTKKDGEGTGMGLALVQGVIKSYGGSITVSSELEQGTTFHIFLPKYEGAILREKTQASTSKGGKERILFVDDEKMLAVLGQQLLESFGYTVTVTTNSLNALEIFRSAPDAFDLIITDMSMPGLTGKELSKRLLDVRPEIPIIICTGFSDQISETQAKESGIRELVMKPYTIKSLDKSIRRVLERGNALL